VDADAEKALQELEQRMGKTAAGPQQTTVQAGVQAAPGDVEKELAELESKLGTAEPAQEAPETPAREDQTQQKQE